MARLFASGSLQYVNFGNISGIEGVSNLTVACWMRKDHPGGTNKLVVSSRSVGTNGLAINHWNDGKVYSNFNNGSASFGTYNDTSNDLHHRAITFDGAGADNPGRLKAYKDGVVQTLSFSGTIPATSGVGSNFLVGRDQSSNSYGNGLIAEVAIWLATLTADELLQIVAGKPPTRVRPGSLFFYSELVGTQATEPDLVGGLSGTLVNAPTADAHPRVVRRRPMQWRPNVVAAGGGGTVIDLTAAAFEWTANALQPSSLLRPTAALFAWSANALQLSTIARLSAATFTFTAQAIGVAANTAVQLTAATFEWTANVIDVVVAGALQLTAATFAWSANALQLSTIARLSAATFTWSAKALQFATIARLTAAAFTFTANAIEVIRDTAIQLTSAVFRFSAKTVEVTGAITAISNWIMRTRRRRGR
jgi:hypothetical protein